MNNNDVFKPLGNLFRNVSKMAKDLSASTSTSSSSGTTISRVGRESSRISLSRAKGEAPNTSGCYKIYCGGLKYVGKAEDGIRKRFVQYYNGTTTSYTSGRKIYENRDRITVSWIELDSREECRRVEREWIERYDPEWNSQSGWSHD